MGGGRGGRGEGGEGRGGRGDVVAEEDEQAGGRAFTPAVRRKAGLQQAQKSEKRDGHEVDPDLAKLVAAAHACTYGG